MDLRKFYAGKSIVVTGAASGLGRQISMDLSREKADLILLDIDAKALQSICDEIKDSGGEVNCYVCDVSDLASVQQIFLEIFSTQKSIDIVICNAGITYLTNFRDFSPTQNFRVMSTNYFGMVNVISQILPHFIKKKSGQIVGISSAAGARGIMLTACYGASKSAITTFLEGLRIDLRGTGIAVTTILPGFIDTPINRPLLERFNLPFMLPVTVAAKKIAVAIAQRKSTYTFPLITKILVLVGGLTPDWLYDYVIANHPFVKKSSKVVACDNPTVENLQ